MQFKETKPIQKYESIFNLFCAGVSEAERKGKGRLLQMLGGDVPLCLTAGIAGFMFLKRPCLFWFISAQKYPNKASNCLLWAIRRRKERWKKETEEESEAGDQMGPRKTEKLLGRAERAD